MKPWVISAVLVAVSFAQEPQPVPPMEYPGVLIRESQEIVVNGLKEDWRLEWAAAPKPFCEPNEISLTCPCMGFAYGESGDLFLVRLRAGREIERLHLTPFFSKTADNAVVQKRAPDYDKDFQASARSDFETLVSKRPIVQVMHFADYDHGGVASEFYVQTEAVPCGKSVGIVVGISRSNPQLHVFGKETDPDKPLFMQKRVWEALRDAGGPFEIQNWACYDHGEDTEGTLLLHWTSKGIDGTRKTYSCPENPKDRLLMYEDPL